MKRILVLNTEDDARRIYGAALDAVPVDYRFMTDHLMDPPQYLERFAPDLVLLSLEWIPQWRILVAEARKQQIPCVYVVDGVLDWSYVWDNQAYILGQGTCLQPLMSHYLCVAGQHQARILAHLGLGPSLRVVGLPRLDGVERRVPGIGPGSDVLVATANTWSMNERHAEMVRDGLRDLVDYFQKPGAPSVRWRIAGELADAFGLEPDDSGGIEEAMARSAAVISFPSTVVLESMLAGLPTAVIDYRQEPSWLQSAWSINGPRDIGPVVGELLDPPAQKLAYQSMCLDDELAPAGASARLAKLFQDLLRGDAEDNAMAVSGQGVLEYQHVHSQVSAFSEGSLSRMQYEVDGHRRHARRNHDVLSEVYDWIRSYLPLRLANGLSRMLGRGDIGMLQRVRKFLGESPKD